MFNIRLESTLVFVFSLVVIGVLFYCVNSDLQNKRIISEKYLQCKTQSGTLFVTEKD